MADPLLPLEMSIVQGTLAKNYFPYLCNVEKLKLNLLSPYILMLSRNKYRNYEYIFQTGSYYLSHIDLHWKSSEHSIDNEFQDLEMQLNHFDLSYNSYEEASKIPGATLSVGLLFKVSYIIIFLEIRN